jgi:hypothetical protein
MGNKILAENGNLGEVASIGRSGGRRYKIPLGPEGYHKMISEPRTSMVAAFVSVILFGPALWMLLDREPPFAVISGHIDPPNPVVNGSIMVTWDIKTERSCRPSSRAKVTRTIVDSKGVRHAYDPVNAIYGTPDQQRNDKVERTVPLPENITGPAKYSSVACYACNPLQEFWPICVQMPEINFEIEPSQEKS